MFLITDTRLNALKVSICPYAPHNIALPLFFVFFLWGLICVWLWFFLVLYCPCPSSATVWIFPDSENDHISLYFEVNSEVVTNGLEIEASYRRKVEETNPIAPFTAATVSINHQHTETESETDGYTDSKRHTRRERDDITEKIFFSFTLALSTIIHMWSRMWRCLDFLAVICLSLRPSWRSFSRKD